MSVLLWELDIGKTSNVSFSSSGLGLAETRATKVPPLAVAVDLIVNLK